MDSLGYIITAVILLASVLLVFVVYIQNPKGGGLSSDFGSAQQIGGVQKTNDFIDRTTWGLAALIGVLSITLTAMTMSPKPKKVDAKQDNTEQPQNQGQGQGQNQGQQKPQGQGNR
jgi:preprotein translocase subunit SecG